MKHTAKTYTLLLLLICNMTAYGQKRGLDSVCVTIDDDMELNMSVYDYSDLSTQVEKDIKNLQSILNDNNDIPDKLSYTINYTPNSLLTIKQNGIEKKIICRDGKQIKNQFKNECIINATNYYLTIKYNDIGRLVSDSLTKKLKNIVDTTYAIQGRFSETYNYSCRGEDLVHNNQLNKVNGQMDALSLKGGVGVNLIKNQPVMDISAEIGLLFSKKGIFKNQYYFSYNQLSDFNDDSKINLNGFANVGYRYNLSNEVNKPNWLGLELGYLITRNGDMFKRNTFKLGVNWEIGKFMSVSPQLYLSDDFSESYPAIRIGFGF